MFKLFIQELTEASRQARVDCEPWTRASKRTRALLRLARGDQSTVLYVKESNQSPGWWGLGPNQLELLQESGERWYLILLGYESEHTYLAAPGEVDQRIGTIWRQAPKDKYYKVHETAELLGVPQLNQGEVIDFLLHEVLTREKSPLQVTNVFAAPKVAEFMCRLPRKSVIRFSRRKPELKDLIASVIALMLSSVDSVKTGVAGVIPILASLFETLGYEDALIIHAMWETGKAPVEEATLFAWVNRELRSRKQPSIEAAVFQAALKRLEGKECIERLPTPTRKWRLVEFVF